MSADGWWWVQVIRDGGRKERVEEKGMEEKGEM